MKKHRPERVRTWSKKFTIAVLFAWIGMLLLPTAAPAQQSSAPKRVLVLYWYKVFSGNARFDQSLQATLHSASAGIELYHEYLESDQFPGENQELLLRDYLRQKYADRKIDVIVASPDPALNFLLKHRKDLFPNTPIVFTAIKRPAAKEFAAGAGLTGIIQANTHRETLELALRLHPGTEQVFVISGKLEGHSTFEILAREELQAYESRVRITYLTDLPLDELIEKTKSLPKGSIALYLWQQSQNKQGKLLEASEVLALIARSASVPIYGLSGSYVGHGIIGGYVSTTEANATRSGEIALRVLSGERAQDIDVENAPTLPNFDWRQLKRWGINESSLPAGSIIQFKELTFWEQYKWRVVGVVGLIVLETLLIVGLLLERNRRRRADSGRRETEERNRAILSALPDLMFLQDKDGVYLDYHAKQPEHLLIPPAQFIGKSMHELLPPSLSESLTSCFDRALKSGETQMCEYDLAVNGKREWFEARIAPCEGSKLLSVVRDVTERKRAEIELRSSEQRFAKVFAANPQPMSLTSVDEGRYLDVNDSFLEMSGYQRDEIIGHTSLELQHWPSSGYRDRLLDPLRAHGEVHNLELDFRTKGGTQRVLLSSAELIELGGQTCILVASSDITARKKLEQQLQQSEREFSTLVENSPDAISRLDRELRYIYVSPVLERISELAPESFLGQTPHEVNLPDYDRRSFEAVCHEALTSRRTAAREFHFRNRQYRTRVIPEFSSNDKVESLMAISEDVTERVRAEQELRKLTARLFSLQDEERRRIARELHDGAAQNIFGITISLGNLQRQKSNADAESSRVINECQAMAEQSLTELRTLSYLLHPPILDHAGLALALQWYVEGFSKRSGVYVDLITLEDIGRLPLEIETALFRIVQESLTNIRRHSGSETASIRLEKRNDEIRLEIADQGRGISENGNGTLDGEVVELGVGIPGMRQRLLQLGGRLEIGSSNQGTTIVAVVPAMEGQAYGKHLTR